MQAKILRLLRIFGERNVAGHVRCQDSNTELCNIGVGIIAVVDPNYLNTLLVSVPDWGVCTYSQGGFAVASSDMVDDGFRFLQFTVTGAAFPLAAGFNLGSLSHRPP